MLKVIINSMPEVLKIIINSLPAEKFDWWLEGSFALRLWGLAVVVRDLDIVTNDRGIDIFRQALATYIQKDSHDPIKGWQLILNINNQEVEISSFADRTINVFGLAQEVAWQGLTVPVLPPVCIRGLYVAINRVDKVLAIDKFIKG